MLFWISAALAAPLTPISSATPVGGVAVSLATGTAVEHLRDSECTEGQCLALANTDRYVGQVEFRPVPFLSVYAEGLRRIEKVRSANYGGAGWGVGAGAKLSFELNRAVGIDGSIGFRSVTTGDITGLDSDRVKQLDISVVGRAGTPDDGIVVWGGLGARPWSTYQLTTLDGVLEIPLEQTFPVNVLVGLMLISQPLGVPWNDRGRLAVSGGLVLGGDVGGDFSLTFNY